MNDLVDKKIVIIGGNGLIGSAIVKHLQHLQASPICVDIKNDNVPGIKFVEFDISQLNKIKEQCRYLTEVEGIEGVVNVSFARAKGWKRSPDEMEWDEWQANIDSQMNSVCLFSSYISQFWKEKSIKGSIVNVASIFGVISPPVYLYDNIDTYPALPYPAIKGGVIAFSTFMAAKYGPSGIRVNCISPGVVEGAPMQTDDKFSAGMKNNMLRRFASPKEIAKPVSFLLSEYSSFITGQNIIVDGGWTNI
jgi:NAD(P)-dependent dehydrogenase (short-subunit alcohol dehydrogenase family)